MCKQSSLVTLDIDLLTSKAIRIFLSDGRYVCESIQTGITILKQICAWTDRHTDTQMDGKENTIGQMLCKLGPDEAIRHSLY